MWVWVCARACEKNRRREESWLPVGLGWPEFSITVHFQKRELLTQMKNFWPFFLPSGCSCISIYHSRAVAWWVFLLLFLLLALRRRVGDEGLLLQSLYVQLVEVIEFRRKYKIFACIISTATKRTTLVCTKIAKSTKKSITRGNNERPSSRYELGAISNLLEANEPLRRNLGSYSCFYEQSALFHLLQFVPKCLLLISKLRTKHCTCGGAEAATTVAAVCCFFFFLRCFLFFDLLVAPSISLSLFTVLPRKPPFRERVQWNGN